MRTITILVISLFVALISNAQSLNNTVWAYTQRMYGLEKTQEITSFFVFTSQTEVIWLFETPRNYMFPVGIGSYDAQRHTITFSYTNPLHKRISLYYGDNTIEFEFSVNQNQNNEARLKLCNEDYFLKRFYDDGAVCRLSKEKYVLQPNPNLTGTSWRYDIDGERGFVYFKSKYEVLIEGEPHLYVSFGNNVFIKSGDNISDENLVGNVNDNKLFLRQDGLDVFGGENKYQMLITMKKVE